MKRLIYNEVTCTVPGDLLDPVTGFLWEMGTLGIELDDGDLGPDADLHDSAKPEVRLKAYFREDQPLDAIREGLERLAPGCVPVGGTVEPEDWLEHWKRYFTSFPVGARFVIHPPWEHAPGAGFEGRLAIQIQPGSAFGTGTHCTTQLCLLCLEETALAGRSLVDVGAGSGILGIAALKLGARSAIAIDNDPEVPRNFRQNTGLNRVEDRLPLIVGGPECVRPGSFDIAVANITLPTIVALAPVLGRLVRHDGRLILSGFLEETAPEVVAAFRPFGFRASVKRREGWGAVVLAGES